MKGKYVKCESLKFCKPWTCFAVWHVTGKEGKIGWIMPIRHLKPKIVVRLFMHQQSWYCRSLLTAGGTWGLLKPWVFHVSNRCMTSVTLIEQPMIVLLIPVSSFLCCSVRWGEVTCPRSGMWVFVGVRSSSRQLNSAPVPHPLVPCLPRMVMGLAPCTPVDCSCFLVC